MSYRTPFSFFLVTSLLVCSAIALGAPPGTPPSPYVPTTPYATPTHSPYRTPPATPYTAPAPTPAPYGTTTPTPYGTTAPTPYYGTTTPAPYQTPTPAPYQAPTPTPSARAGQAVQPSAQAVTMAGTVIRVNGCDVMDVYAGPGDVDTVFLRWSDPASRQDWLQTEFDRVLDSFHGDMWDAFVALGGGLRQASSGFMIEGHVSHNAMIRCGNDDMPVVDVTAVRGAYDLASLRPLPYSSEPLMDSGFDESESGLARILHAGESEREVVISVGGVSNESFGCPPWAFGSASSVTFECGSRRGFVDLRRSNGSAMSARGGSMQVRGRFTGEVSLFRGTEAVFLTPVFEVEERITD